MQFEDTLLYWQQFVCETASIKDEFEVISRLLFLLFALSYDVRGRGTTSHHLRRYPSVILFTEAL